ncbi:MAG TPA: AbrB/MazE/SpoVT family DNA-binding domain-containing protein [Candidatus Brocadiia bacterium]|nr:AbrB/MazE/SpoVT family DNA-binding domain-containing protein [Planctomycetota bacterium]MDO8093102.1 AbrB/MazE/SpoVT family DNA-binding domain-containing protein [Candidatus Brocadiales bacterium]
MKNRAVVSERGTITIPEAIRKLSHIQPGDLIEFKPENDKIILKRLIVKRPDEDAFMSNNEWNKFDKLVQKQLKKGEYRSYTDLDKARGHSRNLMRRKQ